LTATLVGGLIRNMGRLRDPMHGCAIMCAFVWRAVWPRADLARTRARLCAPHRPPGPGGPAQAARGGDAPPLQARAAGACGVFGVCTQQFLCCV
jgi:hypothetical protein